MRGLQEIDVGFRFKFSVPASVATVPVAWIVRPAVQFLGLCAFLFPRTPPMTVLTRHGRELSGFKFIRLALTSPMIAVIVTLSPGWHQGAAWASPGMLALAIATVMATNPIVVMLLNKLREGSADPSW